MCLFVIIIVIGAIYLIRLFNRSYQDYEVMDRVDNTEENREDICNIRVL